MEVANVPYELLEGVEQEKVDWILEAGQIAPTAVNKQPVHIWAVSRPVLSSVVRNVLGSINSLFLVIAGLTGNLV